MKIAVAQTKPVKGDIEKNIDRHLQLINLAVGKGADTIIFPELSITGYEPTLTKQLATTANNNRFDVFQEISDAKKITIGVGMPTKNEAGECITMILFQSNKARFTYSKQYLHEDELPFFIAGTNEAGLIGKEKKAAIAICYEISIPKHAEDAYRNGAEIYIASVAKSVNGIDKAIERLAEIAKKYAMVVVMSNCIGICDGMECAGKSAVWNNEGALVGQLNDKDEGVLIFDTATKEVVIL